MNIFICTARIVSRPIFLQIQSVNLFHITVVVDNFRNTSIPFVVHVFAKGKRTKKILQKCSIGNYIIIQSSIHIKKTLKSSKNDKRKMKNMFMKINNAFSLQ